jgi:hypothetical protein
MWVQLLGLIMGVALAKAASPEGDAYCKQFQESNLIPECGYRAPRDILFIVDASNSMDEDQFYSSVLNYTTLIYCSFDAALPNKIGLMVFAEEIKVSCFIFRDTSILEIGPLVMVMQ